jgi:hypothetical protein
MVKARAILTMLAAAACWPAVAGGADVTAELSPLEQTVAAGPYRRARLEVAVAGGAAVAGVRLRPEGVGPAVRYPLAVAPGSRAEANVLLPAAAASQTYAVTAYDREGRPVGRAEAEIAWPAELIAADALVDESFRGWTDESADWPPSTKKVALAALALFVLIASGTLLIRRQGLRAAAVAAAGLAAGAAALAMAARADAVTLHVFAVTLATAEGEVRDGSFTVVSARRAAEVTLRAAPPAGGADRAGPAIPWPVHGGRDAAGASWAEVRPAESAIRLSLRAGQVRVVRPAVGIRPPAPPGQVGDGRVHVTEEAIEVEAEAAHQRALVIRNDHCWQVQSGFGTLKATLPRGRGRPVSILLSDPDAWSLTAGQVRLLDHWRRRGLRGGRTYLVNFPAAGPGRTEMTVLELTPGGPAGGPPVPEPAGG